MKLQLPRNYTIYQFYLVNGAMGALILGALSYVGHVVNLLYFPKENHWIDWLWIFLCPSMAVAMLLEVFSLRFYKKYQPLDPVEPAPPEPIAPVSNN